MGENAEIYVKAPIYEGITNGSAHKVNKIFDPGKSNLTVIIDIIKPIIKLENTTAKNTIKVLNTKTKTSQNSKKLEIDLEKLRNLQSI